MAEPRNSGTPHQIPSQPLCDQDAQRPFPGTHLLLQHSNKSSDTKRPVLLAPGGRSRRSTTDTQRRLAYAFPCGDPGLGQRHQHSAIICLCRHYLLVVSGQAIAVRHVMPFQIGVYSGRPAPAGSAALSPRCPVPCFCGFDVVWVPMEPIHSPPDLTRTGTPCSRSPGLLRSDNGSDGGRDRDATRPAWSVHAAIFSPPVTCDDPAWCRSADMAGPSIASCRRRTECHEDSRGRIGSPHGFQIS
ncbi:hypothetical protein AWB68_08055 [Caballeronia choica]|uniref:Uncharacterized protein n=1 Tax=Caballeronia choica TaxID=326476 RepID=A0A158L0I9_9BURK|nr:hypothetical protein AWB68_08055 [Caballeronia choica]